MHIYRSIHLLTTISISLCLQAQGRNSINIITALTRSIYQQTPSIQIYNRTKNVNKPMIGEWTKKYRHAIDLN
jgi:hypothetical protein